MTKKTYTCRYSGRVYKTKRGASNSETREERKNCLLNCSSPEGLLREMSLKVKEYYGWDLTIYACRIISVSDCKKIRFRFRYKLATNKKTSSGTNLGGLLLSKFNKLYSYWKPWDSLRDQEIKGHLELDLFLVMEDYPLIQSNYLLFMEKSNKLKEFDKVKKLVREQSREFAYKLAEVKEKEKEIGLLNNSLLEKRAELSKLVESNCDRYFQLWYESNKHSEPVIEEELLSSFSPESRGIFYSSL